MSEQLKKRSELDPALTWDLQALYADLESWQRDFDAIKPMADAFLQYRGHLGDSAETLRDAIVASDEFTRLAEKVYTYAHLKSDEDTADNRNKSRLDRIAALFAQISGDSAFFEPEIMAIDEKKMAEFLESPVLAFYRRSLLELLREKPHTLSEKEERVLGLYSDVLGASDEIFSTLNDADMSFGKVRNDQGKSVELSQGNYRIFLESPRREVRKGAFKKMFGTYRKFRNTLAGTLDATVKRHIVGSRLRNYRSSLAAALQSDNINEEVYTNLIAAVRSHLPALDRYLELRKKRMELETLDMFDLYTPLVADVKLEYSFEEAAMLVKKALAPLGKEYGKLLDRAFQERWVDIPENRGKRSGAYSSGCYDSYPYLLLNFNGTLNDVFTLAHELGHSLHSYYSNRTQEYHYADYSIFVAEVASTTNELLLSDYLLKHTRDPKLKAYLLGHLADEIRTTIYRQTMFAEFELKIHRLAEENTPLAADLLCEEYARLNHDYYGRVCTPSPEIEMEWARIPHFYYNFYVYKYATGMSAAVQLSQNILSKDPAKVEDYFNFLKAGDSKDVLDIMRDAGVDLSTPEPIHTALNFFDRIVGQI